MTCPILGRAEKTVLQKDIKQLGFRNKWFLNFNSLYGPKKRSSQKRFLPKPPEMGKEKLVKMGMKFSVDDVTI
jgi:hypothetical protein